MLTYYHRPTGKGNLFWSNGSVRGILIGAAQSKASAVSISAGTYKPKRNCMIRNHLFINAVMKITGWRGDLTYTVHGEYIPGLAMVAFKLDEACISGLDLPETEAVADA